MIKNELIKFLESKVRNQWITDDHHEIYVRKSQRHGIKFLDIANITVNPQGTGLFKSFLELAQTLALKYDLDGIYIENVHNKSLYAHLYRRTKIDPNWEVSKIHPSDFLWVRPSLNWDKSFWRYI